MEPSGDPVWGVRAQRLQEWLKLVGPKTVEEIYREWAIGKMISETLLTNILAYAEGGYIIPMNGKWWAFPVAYQEKPSKAACTEAAPTSEECPEKSESAEVACPEPAPTPPDPGESQPDIPHPPA